MKLWLLLCLVLLWDQLQHGECQQAKRRKDNAENRIRPGGKRVKVRPPKLKDGGGKGQSLLTQVLEKGNFLRLGASATLSLGKTLELRCKGSRIGWSYPAYLDTFKDPRLSINQSNKYGQLVLTAPSAADTGTYSCWTMRCEGAECAKDPEQVHASYIYFRDKDNLFVPSAIHFEIIYLRPDTPATVPCRVTDPQSKVTLHREVPPEEIPSNGTGVTYDPTKGFILKTPTSQDEGVFYCKAVTRGTPQISTKYQLLYVEVPRNPPFVSMEAPKSVARGENINVTCRVLGVPEEDVTITWSSPGQDFRVVNIQSSWRLVSRDKGHLIRITQSVLRVDEMLNIDYGSYTCRAKNQHGETVMTTTVGAM